MSFVIQSIHDIGVSAQQMLNAATANQQAKEEGVARPVLPRGMLKISLVRENGGERFDVVEMEKIPSLHILIPLGSRVELVPPGLLEAGRVAPLYARNVRKVLSPAGPRDDHALDRLVSDCRERLAIAREGRFYREPLPEKVVLEAAVQDESREEDEIDFDEDDLVAAMEEAEQAHMAASGAAPLATMAIPTAARWSSCDLNDDFDDDDNDALFAALVDGGYETPRPGNRTSKQTVDQIETCDDLRKQVGGPELKFVYLSQILSLGLDRAYKLIRAFVHFVEPAPPSLVLDDGSGVQMAFPIAKSFLNQMLGNDIAPTVDSIRQLNLESLQGLFATDAHGHLVGMDDFSEDIASAIFC